jgi:cellobiose phosphorylase
VREILLQYCDDATWKAVKEASLGKAHNTFAAIVSEAVVEGQAKVHTDALAYVQGCLGNKGGLGGN